MNMTIQVGDKIPNVTIATVISGSSSETTTDEIFRGKKVVMFALPGAFTPTCTASHLPSYVVKHNEIKAKGVDTIACLSVNDQFVMKAWGESQNTDGNILLIADGSCNLTQALGMELDLTERGLGVRSQRYVIIADDGVITHLNLEPSPGELSNSDADTVLGML